MGRVRYIDILKGLAIIFIVNVHIPVQYRPFVNGVTFHVTAFYTAVGLSYAYKADLKSLDLKILIKKRFNQIIKPYFFVSAIWIVVNVIILIYDKCDLKYILLEVLTYIYKTLSFTGIGVMWFLPTLYFSEILFLFIEKNRQNSKNIIFVLLLFCNILFLPILKSYNIIGKLHVDVLSNFTSLVYNEVIVVSQTLIALTFIYFGYVIKNLIEKIIISKKHQICLIAVIAIALCINYILSINQKNDMHYANISSPVIFFIVSFLGTSILIIVSKLIAFFKYLSIPFEWLGKNTLIIMVTHNECGIIFLSIFVLSRFYILKDNFLSKILLLITIMIIEYIVVSVAKSIFRQFSILNKDGKREN